MSLPFRKTGAFALAIGLLALALFATAYWKTASAPLLWDDENFIVKNKAVHSLQNPLTYITDRETLSSIPYYNRAIYRPLRTFLFAVEHKLFGLSPLGYHLVSFFLHVVVSGFFVWLLLRLGASLGLGVLLGALWMLHPAHTEVASFVSSQGDLLCAFFLLLGALVITTDVAHAKRKRLLYVAFAGAYILALFSKEIGVVAFIGYALLLWVAPLDRQERLRRLRASLCIGISLSALYLWWRWRLLGELTQNEGATAHVLENLVVLVPKTLTAYLGFFLLPIQQNAFYGEIRWLGVEPFFLIAFLGSALFPVFFPTENGGRKQTVLRVLVGLAWFVVFLGLVSNLVPISVMFAERFLYLPSIGILLALLPALKRLSDRGQQIIIILLLCLFALVTKERNILWTDEVQLFQDAVAKSDTYPPAQRNLIQALFERERYEEALREFDRYKKLEDLTPDLAAMKLECACRTENWNRCVKIAVPLLHVPDYADHAVLWLAHAEEALGRVDRAKDLMRQYCRKHPKAARCRAP